MITFSQGMQTFFSNKRKINVPTRLIKVIDQGFSDKKGAIIFSSFKELMHIKLVEPQDTFDIHSDLTGFECFANKIFLDDYINKSKISLPYLANLSFSVADLFIKKWNSSMKGDCLLIFNLEKNSEFGDSATFRFHKIREDETWLDTSNTATSNELIMILDNNNSIFE